MSDFLRRTTPYTQLIIRQEQRRYHRFRRFIRATWQDSNALVREFRRPLLAILVFIILGGWLYGELTVYAGYPAIAPIDLPYVMLALITFENPVGYVPAEWYLIIFWYLQPLVGIYIIGRGAVDFGRLFFNRHERKSAWELAVAQTYRNHVVIVGLGHVGMRVARTLVQMGFDVVAVDNELDDGLDFELNKLDIPLIAEDGRMTETLVQAGIEHARALVICTSNDHVNLELTMRARDLNPTTRIVTRMWDSRFALQLKRFLNVEVMSASDFAAPAFAGSAVGVEITQTLHIGDKEYSMIKLIVEPDSFMAGRTIDVLQEDEDVDIVLHGRNGSEPVVHPDGSVVVHAGDTLVIFAKHAKIVDLVTRNRPL